MPLTSIGPHLTLHRPFPTLYATYFTQENFIQLVEEATHVQGNTLDVIIPHRFNNLIIPKDQVNLKSDHYLLAVDLLSHTTANSFTSKKNKCTTVKEQISKKWKNTCSTRVKLS